MKTIGMIGGMSWESTVTYYKVINEAVKNHLGGFHSAKCLLYSVDFHEIEALQTSGSWDESGELLAEVAHNLEKAGADFIVICTNTMHKVAPMMEKSIRIPILHIAEATADVLLKAGINRVGLLGTKYTMTQDFYKEKLIQKGLCVLVPSQHDIELINSVIFQELCLGRINGESKEEFLRIIQSLSDQGAEAVVLGCTEIGLLVQQQDTTVPLYDTTMIHAEAAANYALE